MGWRSSNALATPSPFTVHRSPFTVHRSRLRSGLPTPARPRGGLLPDLNRDDVVLRRWGERVTAAGNRDRLTRLLVDEALPLVIPEDHLVLVDLLDVLRKEWHLAAAPGRVDHEMRNGEPGGPPAQRLHDLESLLDLCAEVLAARDLIGHVDVVRPHARLEQLLHQLLHHLRIVVHAAQQHGLAAERDAGVRESR